MLPRNPKQKINKMLQAIYYKSSFFQQYVSLEVFSYSLGYCKDYNEMINVLYAIRDKDYITIHSDSSESKSIKCQLLLAGYEYLESIETETTTNKKCFVAMWFSEQMLATFQHTISRAITDSGYEPFIISMLEHNENITDHIIGEIRACKFFIADFTGNRGGVYFEAGFAMGLNKPVIWTCNKKYFNQLVSENKKGKILDSDTEIDVVIEESYKIHFDVDHYNFIVWETETELYTKLKDRILASIV